jgi:hypothetical protein
MAYTRTRRALLRLIGLIVLAASMSGAAPLLPTQAASLFAPQVNETLYHATLRTSLERFYTIR